MAEKDEKVLEPGGDLEDLFEMFPEGTRIIIQDGKVTFENMTEELLEVAEALNPDDPNIKKRLSER